jgi:D-arabinose 5-phosphate isomerase GutQ
VAAVTAASESPLGELSDLRVLIPSESKQYGRALFEQAALVLLDALALLLQRRLGQSAADLEARHANLE